MTIGASNEWSVGIRHFVVLVVVESRFHKRVLMTLDARFVLNMHDNDGGLTRDLRIMLERVPGCQGEDLGSTDNALAHMASNALDVFFSIMQCGEIRRVVLRDGARESR